MVSAAEMFPASSKINLRVKEGKRAAEDLNRISNNKKMRLGRPSGDARGSSTVSLTPSPEPSDASVILSREIIGVGVECDESKRSILSRNVFQNSDFNALKNGCSISIFWKQDLSWYVGTVQRKEESGGNISIAFLYDDGISERIEDIKMHKWRMLIEQEPSLGVSIDINLNEREDVFKSFHAREASQKKSSKSESLLGNEYIKISLQDFYALQKDNWTSDEVIHALITNLLQKADHKTNQRFVYVSSQAIVFVSSEDRGRQSVLRGWLRGVELHEVDEIIWPLHIANASHWCLCVAYLCNKEFVVLDPYHCLHGRISRNILRTVTTGLRHLSSSYDEKYGEKREWRKVAPMSLANHLNLPA